jgi:quercetin dioxygenase-like cupin family protein
MKRRSFLRNAAAALPAASFGALSFNQLASAQSPDAPHLVNSGQDLLGETHSLGFSTILFKVLPRETSNNLFVIEHQHLLKGGPPVHLHHSQEEWYYVIQGRILFQVGDERKVLGPGDSLLGPRGVPHAFVGQGDAPAHMVIAFSPAGKMEAFFREAAVPNGPKMDAALFARFDMQYVGPPLVVS